MNWDIISTISPTFILINTISSYDNSIGFINNIDNNNLTNKNNYYVNDMIVIDNNDLSSSSSSSLSSSSLSFNQNELNNTLILNLSDFYNLNVNNNFYNNNNYNDNINDTIYNSNIQFPCSTNQKSISNIISMILYAVVCIIGLFGNTLVIYVVLRYSKMQTVTNMYILNLAIADECYLIGIPFLLITIHLGYWTFGQIICKAYMVSTSITQFTSSIFLLIMSADRYIAVCHPISSSRFRTPFISKIVSLIAWLTSVVIMLPVILFSNTIKHEKGYSCIIKWPENHGQESGTTFTLYALILGFAIPLSFILIFYYLVIKKLHTVGPKNKSKEKKRSHRKVTKLVLTVITIYVLCWLPHWISQVALIHSPPQNCRSRLEITIFLLVGCLGYSNSAMNPILYAFLSDNFKKSFMKAFTCANSKELNGQLQLEHSLFPKFGRNRNGSKRLLAKKLSNLTGGNGGSGSGGGIGGSSSGSSGINNKNKKQLQNQQNKLQQQFEQYNERTNNTTITTATAATTIYVDQTTTITLPGKSTVTIATNVSEIERSQSNYGDNDDDNDVVEYADNNGKSTILSSAPVLHTDL